jgi:hypothetical protein
METIQAQPLKAEEANRYSTTQIFGLGWAAVFAAVLILNALSY